jgi:Icc-related predicted phosphoesterase
MRCAFASDLHGRPSRYEALLASLAADPPEVLLLGGDLLPHAFSDQLGQGSGGDFLRDFLGPRLEAARTCLGVRYPRVLYIPGNDDPRNEMASAAALEAAGLWRDLHLGRVTIGLWTFFGYAFVPPTPFLLKDWERYDVSRFVDPGCVPPEEGWRTHPVDAEEARTATIHEDLRALAGDESLERSIWLFHAPPYQTHLDRAALDGRSVEHAPLDVHVGSVAIRRFLDARQPRLSLHGHVHESARLTGAWRDLLGATHVMSAAHDGPELSLVRFEPERPEQASRLLL